MSLSSTILFCASWHIIMLKSQLVRRFDIIAESDFSDDAFSCVYIFPRLSLINLTIYPFFSVCGHKFDPLAGNYNQLDEMDWWKAITWIIVGRVVSLMSNFAIKPSLGPVLLTLLRHVARILANGRAAFFEIQGLSVVKRGNITIPADNTLSKISTACGS